MKTYDQSIEDVTIKIAAIKRKEKLTVAVYFWLPLTIILGLASFIRLYALSIYPRLFNQDSMVLGYDAWSIWTTGHDQHGQLFPIYFRTFNDYVPPIANYMMAPIVGIFGLSEVTLRLPFALMGIATVLLVALIGRRWFHPVVGLLAALLLAIDPWHINYSRTSFPNSCVPFFLCMALYAFTRATTLLAPEVQATLVGRVKWRVLGWMSVSAVAFALLTGVYPTLKVNGPILVIACVLAALPVLWRYHSRFVLCSYGWFIVLYGLCCAPLAVAQLLDWNQIQIRYQSMSVFQQKNWMGVFFSQYAHHYDPGLLFFDGLKGGVAVHPPAIGELFWLEGLFWIVAVVGLWQMRHISQRVGFNIPIVLVIWFFSFPIASSMTTLDVPHEIRSYCFLPLPELLAGYGALIAWEELSRWRIKWVSLAQGVFAVILLLFCAFNIIFLRFYFSGALPTDINEIPYNVGLQPVMTQVMQQVKPCDSVWMDETNQTYIYYLFTAKVPPRQFQPIAKQVDSQGLSFSSVGQVKFGVPDLHQPSACNGTGRTFWITRAQNVDATWHSIATYQAKNGMFLWHGFILNR